MCGIVGEMRFDSAPAPEERIRTMLGAVAHRGPDASGIVCFGPAAFGHARLSIVDLSPDGVQPMANEDDTVWVTFNGEIYNHRQLRKELLEAGHTFKSRSDTEVLVHLYEEHGVGFVDRLRGMYAFALWDGRNRRLLLARDRVGKKPLFYALGPDCIRFASELRALTLTGLGQTDPVALHHYLTLQYVPAPMTAFRDIRRLPPASTMVVELSGATTIHRYWRLERGSHSCADENEAIERTLSLLDDATADRLMGDVPVGAFLSGGVDSSLVVSSMARQSSNPVPTFSIRFAEASHDESQYARAVAQMYGTDHHEYVVKPKAVEILPDLIRHFGEPFADSSAVPTFYIAQQTRASVKVALTGDGGDEAFGGYQRYVEWRRIALINRVLPRGLRAKFASMEYSRFADSSVDVLMRRLRRGLRVASLDGLSRYVELISYFPPEERDELYTDEFASAMADEHTAQVLAPAWEARPRMTDLDRLLCTDFENYLPDDLLVKVDITSMYHGLEARAPFLDHRLLEYAASLPDNLKVRRGETKYLLKRAALRRLPPEVVLRPKMGFAVPLADWLRHDLREYATDTLLSRASLSRGYFNPRSVHRLLDDHLKGRVDNANRIWALLCFEVWHREFIDHDGAGR